MVSVYNWMSSGKITNRSSTGKTILFLVALLLVQFTWSEAYTYLGACHSGDIVQGFSARSLAMGGTSLASGNDCSSYITNPSSLLSGGKTALSFSVGAIGLAEKVITEDALTYLNSQAYFQFRGFAVAVPLGAKFAVGMALVPLQDNHYQHEKSVLAQGSGEGIGEVTIKGTGTIYTYSIGGGWRVGSFLSLGASVNLIRGETRIEEKAILFTSCPDAITQMERAVFGLQFTLGTILSFTDEIKAGIAMRTGGQGRENWKINYSGDVQRHIFKLGVPPGYAFGVSYKYQDRSLLVMELTLNEWSRCRPSDRFIYNDTCEFHLGTEYYLKENACLRYGFYLLPFYGKKAFQVMTITGGLGYKVNQKVCVDIGLAFGKRNYYGDNAFFATNQRVDETTITFLAGVTLHD